MATAFKIIKKTEFSYEGEPQTHFVLAYQGRVFSFSTFNFPADKFTVSGNVLTVSTPIEIAKKQTADIVTGMINTQLTILPKCDLDLALI